RRRPGWPSLRRPAQEIGADVERDLTPLANETGGAPRAYGAHRRGTSVRRRGGVERLVRALAVRQLGNRRDHVLRRGVDHLGGSELLGKLAPLGCDVDGDDARAHLDGELRRREAHRALAEDGDRFAALQLEASQRAPGRAVPQEMAAPVTKESESGSGTS